MEHSVVIFSQFFRDLATRESVKTKLAQCEIYALFVAIF